MTSTAQHVNSRLLGYENNIRIGLKKKLNKRFEKFFYMPDHDLIKIFISRLNRLGVRYIVTGAVASIIYGEPRLTHDLDLVIELNSEEVDRFATAFPIEEFYCPPSEVIQIEIARQQRGHFNLIHHNTGFKADIYPSGQDKLHQWALKNRNHVDFEGEILWFGSY